jgi:hypothetical protein
MPDCSICGEKIREGSRTCSVCGSTADEFLPLVTVPIQPAPAVSLPKKLPPGGSYCPACAKVYGPEYEDVFCVCGTELVKELRLEEPLAEIPTARVLDEAPPPMAAILDEAPPSPLAPLLPGERGSGEEAHTTEDADASAVSLRVVKPSPGTPCLVLYGSDKSPVQYFALTKDAMLIGRLDAVAGVFPDIDLDEWFDRATIRRISRQHALILRTRANSTFVLRPLAGNTGTQLETQMVAPQQDYPLRPGHHIILGGAIRLKFEIA